MKCKRLFLAWLLSLMLIGTFAVFLPKVKAVSVSNVVVSFTPPYGTVNHVQTDSEGNIYYGNELGNIYKSIDGGTTWTAWFTEENSASNFVYMILPASNGSWFVYAQGTGNPIWQSNDNGATWVSSYAGIQNNIWHYDEMSNGTLIMNPYGTTDPDVLYVTDDFGDSWRQINLTTLGFTTPYHIHSVRVNPYTQDIWVIVGDVGDAIQLIKYNSTGWFTMAQGLARYWKTDVGFDDTYVYFLSDTGLDKITRMPHAGNVTTDLVDVLRSDQWTGGTHFGKFIEEIDGLLFASTRHGTMWASWDGEHWVALVDNDSASGYQPENFAWYRSVDNAIIALDKDDNKIYKFYVDEKVLKHLFYKDSVSVSGSTVTFTQTLKSGSDSAIDLSDYGVDSPTVKLTGVSHNLIASNGTFESGTLSEWYERWSTISVTSSEAYAGSYSLNFTEGVKGAVGLSVLSPEFYDSGAGGAGVGYKSRKGFIYVVSLWAKSNVSSTDAYGVQARFKNTTDNDLQTWQTFNPLSTSWTRFESVWIVPNSYNEVTFYITNNYASGQELYIDNFLIEYHEAQVYDSGGLGKQYFGGWVSSMFTANQTTTDPSVTIQSQTKSHSGSLANNTDSTSTSITLTSGVSDITTSVTGSALVKVTIEGTQSFTLTNAIIKNRIASGLYNATYYATPTVTTTTNLLILADENSSIPSASLTSTALTLTVSGYSGLSTTTLVYVGDRGEPNSVTGATSSSYDSATNILTVTVNHASEQQIEIEWTIPSTLITLVRNNYYTVLTLLGLLPLILGSIIVVGVIKGKQTLTAKDVGALIALFVTIVLTFLIIWNIMNAIIGG